MEISVKVAAGLLLAIGILPSPTLAQSWATLAPIRAGLIQEHTTVALGSNTIATVGGLLGNSSSTTNALLLYDIPSNTWSTGPSMPVALNHPNVASIGNTVYVLSGLAGSSGWPAVPTAVYRYTHGQGGWTAGEAMPAGTARGGAAVAVHNGTIYLAGGIPSLSGRSVATVSAYDTRTNTWLRQTLPPLPAARDHVGGAVVGTRLYVVAGRDSGIQNVRDTVYILELANINAGWRTSAGRMPTARGGIAMAVVGGKIWTFGGEGNRAAGTNGVFGETEVFDTVSETWSSGLRMRQPKHGTSAVAVDGKIYIPGGAVLQGIGPVDTVDVFTP